MKSNKYKNITESLLAQAGIKINGGNPWDIQVKNEKFYARVLRGGSLALGESYMDDWWECERLDEFFNKILGAKLEKEIKKDWRLWAGAAAAFLFNRQSKARAFIVGEEHYNAGNDLFSRMLDKRMVYTCGYWKNARDLGEAQEQKLDLVCRKLKLKPGMRVLDIGCGWGSFMKYAAEKYGVECVGATVSREQAELGREMCKGLPVEFRLQDYRELNEKFDAIVSLGMFEHVGYKNYREFMRVAKNCLRDKGLFLLHTIGGNKSTIKTDPWIDKYIFPNGMLPSIKQIGEAGESFFVMEDWHNFGADYDKTLMTWHENFVNSWPEIAANYDERFYRMWNYYLLSCAGSFRARKNQLWQIVFSKNGIDGGYESVR